MKARDTEALISLFESKRICYIWQIQQYYDKDEKIFIKESNVLRYLDLYNKDELIIATSLWLIKRYKWLTYWIDKEWYLNLLDMNNILKPNLKMPLKSEWIKTLLYSVCGGNQENIEWLEKAILYKHMNVADYNIPAVILYGSWWTWKWTLIKLLWTIFWKENINADLGQKHILWNFNSNLKNKLIVEFAEISNNNLNKDTQINNILKSFILAKDLQINEKFISTYTVPNTVWFFISSNEHLPIKLDDTSVWNRRYTVMYSNIKLTNTDNVYAEIEDSTIVECYLWYLYEKYADEVSKWKKVEALENEDKKQLEDNSKSISNQFWDWYEERYTDYKLPIKKIYMYLEDFCNEEEIDFWEAKKYFWKESRYMRKSIKINWKVYKGVLIDKLKR